jgi:penicillin V acylase-like amidase (Ntn superfamily)
MLKSAIDAKSKNDALAALKLLEGDVHRWQVDYSVIAITMHDQNSLTDAVNKEDWALANKILLNLNAKYGHPE